MYLCYWRIRTNKKELLFALVFKNEIEKLSSVSEEENIVQWNFTESIKTFEISWK